jgi:hypothetical protein
LLSLSLAVGLAVDMRQQAGADQQREKQLPPAEPHTVDVASSLHPSSTASHTSHNPLLHRSWRLAPSGKPPQSQSSKQNGGEPALLFLKVSHAFDYYMYLESLRWDFVRSCNIVSLVEEMYLFTIITMYGVLVWHDLTLLPNMSKRMSTKLCIFGGSGSGSGRPVGRWWLNVSYRSPMIKATQFCERSAGK